MLNIPHNKLSNAIDEASQQANIIIRLEQINNATPDRKYRCGTIAKPKCINGWYIFKHDVATDFITLIYGNFELGDDIKFKHHINLQEQSNFINRTPEERKKLQEQINAKIEADRLKKSQEAAKKRNYYVNEYNKFSNCQTHEHLGNKGILHPQYYQLRLDNRYNNNLLCVPFVDNQGHIQGYQSIAVDGSKKFHGSVGGYYWQYPVSNPCPEVFNQNNMFYILCEGLATGLSAYEAIIECFDSQVYQPMILCAFNVGNLDKVITATKANKLPYLLLVDNDSNKPRNAGIEAAKALLDAHTDCEIYPLTFNDGNDANDFIQKHGAFAFVNLIKQYANPVINKIFK